MATVGERFQVVIERDIRAELGVRPGDRAVETIENGRLVLTFLPARHRRSLRGRLARRGGGGEGTEVRDDAGVADSIARDRGGAG